MNSIIPLSDKVKATRTGLIIKGNLPFDEWKDIGKTLQEVEGAVHWWIGDWLDYGEIHYGETYPQAIEATGFKNQTLQNDKWVSSRIEFSRRRENLSWTHHSMIAAFEPEEQNILLEQAENYGWSTSTFNDEIKKYKRLLLSESIQMKLSERWHIYHADMTEWEAPRQYDFIITDPPYPKEYLPLWEALVIRSKKWLKPTGLLIAMSGQSYLDEIYAMFSKHLNYYWTASYLLPGQPTPLRQKQINTNWKPLLIYSINGYKGKTFGDTFISDGNDKSFHEWGQSESGMNDIVSKICVPGQYILDPFCGAGTTGIAALKNDCFFDGLDIDENNCKISNKRLNDTTKTR